jgi:hypothetical protein
VIVDKTLDSADGTNEIVTVALTIQGFGDVKLLVDTMGAIDGALTVYASDDS